jgi:hypothetical protein
MNEWREQEGLLVERPPLLSFHQLLSKLDSNSYRL